MHECDRASRAQFGFRLSPGFGVNVGDDDAKPAGKEPPGNCLSNTLCSARDNGGVILFVFHVPLLVARSLLLLR